MKTNENQKSTNSQPATQKPFFGGSPEQAFFTAERAGATPFFQQKASSSPTLQAKSATDETEELNQSAVQRMPAFESEVNDKGAVQRKLVNSPPHLSTPPIQAKLTIGEPGDKYEQEADRVASQVVEQINAPTTAQSTQGQSVQRQEEKPDELQAKPEITALQRQKEQPEELQAKSTLKSGEAIAGGEASPDLSSAVNRAVGGGQPLEAGLQQSMGQAMGADFSGVKVHTDAQSDQLNRSIQAKAFTTGQDVFFRQGTYDPRSRGGQELIAHELTHVVQQRGESRVRKINSERTMQRKVEKQKYVAEDQRTIRGVIKAQGLDSFYEVPEKVPKIDDLKRASSASAKIIKNSKKPGRGKNSKEYENIGDLARWEGLALSPMPQKFDVGHLIGDQFFDSGQKDEAYIAENLAPQASSFNRGPYLTVEKGMKTILKTQNGYISFNVKVKYGPDISISLGMLVDRKALLIKPDTQGGAKNKGKQPSLYHKTNEKKEILVPRRVPSSWSIDPPILHYKVKGKDKSKELESFQKTWDRWVKKKAILRYLPKVTYYALKRKKGGYRVHQGIVLEQPRGANGAKQFAMLGNYGPKERERGFRTIFQSGQQTIGQVARKWIEEMAKGGLGIKRTWSQDRIFIYQGILSRIVDNIQRSSTYTEVKDKLIERINEKLQEEKVKKLTSKEKKILSTLLDDELSEGEDENTLLANMDMPDDQ